MNVYFPFLSDQLKYRPKKVHITNNLQIRKTDIFEALCELGCALFLSDFFAFKYRTLDHLKDYIEWDNGPHCQRYTRGGSYTW